MDQAEQIQLTCDGHSEHQLRCVEAAVDRTQLAERAVQNDLERVRSALVTSAFRFDSLVVNLSELVKEQLTLVTAQRRDDPTLDHDFWVVTRCVNIRDHALGAGLEVHIDVVLTVQTTQAELVETVTQSERLRQPFRQFGRTVGAVDDELSFFQPSDELVDDLTVRLDERRGGVADRTRYELLTTLDPYLLLEDRLCGLSVGLAAQVQVVDFAQCDPCVNFLTHRVEQPRCLLDVVVAVVFDDLQLLRRVDFIVVMERHVLQGRGVHAPFVRLQAEHDPLGDFLDVNVVVLNEVQFELPVRLP